MPEIEVEEESAHVVRVRKDQFDMLQQAVIEAVEDVTALAQILNITPPQGMAPYLVMREFLLPRVAQLVHTQRLVDESAREIRERALRFGNKTKDFGKGVKGLKVGEKIPGLFDGPRG